MRASTYNPIFRLFLAAAIGAASLAGCNNTRNTAVTAPPASSAPTTAPTAAPALTTLAFGAAMTGGQEVPAVTTTGTGIATVDISKDESRVTISVSVSGLSGPITVAHIHQGAPGVSGGIVKDLAFDAGTTDFVGSWTSTDASQPLTPALIAALRNGQLYVNVHTAANPAGEVRGQLFNTGHYSDVFLTGAQETPPVAATVSTAGYITLNDAGTQAAFYLDATGLTNVTAAHIHNGAPGVAGGIVKNITFPAGVTAATGVWTSADATQPLTADLVTALKAGNLYFNIHTAANPAGEIRGQLVKGTNFTARLTGAQETPAVTSTGSATGFAFLQQGETAVTVYLEFAGLTPTAAHIHQGAPAVAGGIVKNITLTGKYGWFLWTTTDASQPLTPALVTALKTGQLYFNIHTAANPAGEIRGQITE